MGISVLILTDHLTHNESNSFYKLSEGFLRDDRVSTVWLCSRGMAVNRGFFTNETPVLHAIRMRPDFQFSEMHYSWDLKAKKFRVNDFDSILLRIPRPVEASFLKHLEEDFHAPERIVNRPSGIAEISSKAFLTQVRHLCPPLAMVSSLSEVTAAYQTIGPIVIKPLTQYGGKGVVRYDGKVVEDMNGSRSLDEWIDTVDGQGGFPMLAMKYLPRVTEGDKRIIVAHREVIGASLRMPMRGSWICNVAQGGQAGIAKPDQREMEIAGELGEILEQKGVILFGFDTLVDDEGNRVLSEINALSPGGIWPAEKQTGLPLTRRAAAKIIDYLMETYK